MRILIEDNNNFQTQICYKLESSKVLRFSILVLSSHMKAEINYLKNEVDIRCKLQFFYEFKTSILKNEFNY